MTRAHTYRCTRIRRWVERSNDTEILPLCPFCRGCIIATPGYDFRKGQGAKHASAITATIQGYNVRHWSEEGLDFWAVSDLAGDELNEFVQKITAALRIPSALS